MDWTTRSPLWIILFGVNFLLPLAWAQEATNSELQWTAYRIREDASQPLNSNGGWAAGENKKANLYYDRPFRLRVELEGGSKPAPFQELRLQFRQGGGAWQSVGISDFPYPRYATPALSIVTSPAYVHGEETLDLLQGSSREHEEGLGLNGASTTPLFSLGEESMEWEWPLVIRRFSDGPLFADDGETFRLRLVDAQSNPIAGLESAEITIRAEAGHLGGTFIETPARIGPYQSKAGNLYFLMEPTETDNRFMMVKSTDHGKSWREVDGEGRPRVGDLEGVGSVYQDGIIHIIHQTSQAVFYHAFRTEDHPSGEGWIVDSQEIARPGEPPTQVAALTSRPDGSLVAAYGSPEKIFLQLRSPEGSWGKPFAVGSNSLLGLSGCQMVTDANGRTTLVYTDAEGSGWLQTLYRDGTLTRPIRVDASLGIEDEQNGAFLPLSLPETGLPAILYRKEDGTLWERRVFQGDVLSSPVQVTRRKVVGSAVDSDQVGADAIAFGNAVHLLFIEASSRALYYTVSKKPGVWSEPRPVIAGIDAAWVRGNLLQDAQGNPIYGFVYDAGSQGGAGMNQYFAIPLE